MSDPIQVPWSLALTDPRVRHLQHAVTSYGRDAEMTYTHRRAGSATGVRAVWWYGMGAIGDETRVSYSVERGARGREVARAIAESMASLH